MVCHFELMKKLPLVLFPLILLMPVKALGQYIRWTANRRLSWADYTGPAEHNQYAARTNLYVNYTYHWHFSFHIFAYTFNVNNRFNKATSWSLKNKQTPALLKHEQLHFDISELYARRLYIALNEKTYSADYKMETAQIFSRIIGALNAAQDKYDTETQHFFSTKKQREWEADIARQLRETPPYP